MALPYRIVIVGAPPVLMLDAARYQARVKKKAQGREKIVIDLLGEMRLRKRV